MAKFEIRQRRLDGSIRDIGFTDDYYTAAQMYAAGYLVSGFNYPPFVNAEGNR